MLRMNRRLQIVFYVAALCAVAVLLVVYGRGLIGLFDDKAATAKLKVRQITEACRAYAIDHGSYPANLEMLVMQDSDGKGPYLASDTIRDPWGKTYQYDPAGTNQANVGAMIVVPDVFCVAPDGQLISN